MTTKPPAAPNDTPPAPVETLTDDERAALGRLRARRGSGPDLKLKGKDGKVTVATTHPDHATGRALLMDAIGTAEPAFLDPFLTQLVNVASQGPDADEAATNFLLAVVKGVKPTDQLEAMLAMQMGAVHLATATMARRLAHVDNLQQQDSAERALSRLARTFAAQLEALKRYRTGGEQRVTVQHVTVNEGGQAVVGHVQGGGAGRGEGLR